MECPFCMKEMEKGTLQSRGGVFFLPDGESLPKLYTDKEMSKHNAIYLPPYMLSAKAKHPTAYICKSCSKIVIDY